jgi:hypothetical protein
MTKFTDRIENDLEQIADQATPSSDAWQTIQNRMAEPATNDAREIIMLTDERELAEETAEGRRRNWLAVAAAIALLAVAAGVIFGTGGSDELDITDEPVTEDIIEESLEEAPTTTVAPTTTEPPQAVTEILPGVTLNPGGTYETDTLGMELQLEVAEPMRTTRIRPGEFQVVDQETETKFIVVARIGGWYTLAESSDPTFDQQGSIAPADLEEWIADNQLIATRRDDTTIDGRPAVVYDFRTDAEVEGSVSDQGKQNLVYSVAEPSFDPATAAARDRTIVPQMSLRLWLVDAEGFAPIAIFAVAAQGPPDTPDISAGWLDEFEATILPTMDFGPDGPSLLLE